MLHVNKDLEGLTLVSGRGKKRKLTLQGLTILLYKKTVGTTIYWYQYEQPCKIADNKQSSILGFRLELFMSCLAFPPTNETAMAPLGSSMPGNF